MYKVICAQCEEIGYTASPKYLRCECGGKLIVISVDAIRLEEPNKIEHDEAQREV